MPGEGQLAAGAEDPHSVVGGIVGRCEQEGGLRQVRPFGDLQHLVGADPLGVVHDGERIAGEPGGGEHVEL